MSSWHQALSVAALAIAGVAAGYPKPATVPYRWQLDFDAGDLRLYVDQESSDAYWHFTYQVTNRTSKDQVWAPRFTLFTDAGEIMISGREVPSRVTEDLLELLGNELLESQHEAIGDLLQGPEHAREGLVVWPARDTSVNELKMFVRGLSGESARIKNPATAQELVLYKTLQRDYLVPGDALARGNDPIGLVSERWILR